MDVYSQIPKEVLRRLRGVTEVGRYSLLIDAMVLKDFNNSDLDDWFRRATLARERYDVEGWGRINLTGREIAQLWSCSAPSAIKQLKAWVGAGVLGIDVYTPDCDPWANPQAYRVNSFYKHLGFTLSSQLPEEMPESYKNYRVKVETPRFEAGALVAVPTSVVDMDDFIAAYRAAGKQRPSRAEWARFDALVTHTVQQTLRNNLHEGDAEFGKVGLTQAEIAKRWGRSYNKSWDLIVKWAKIGLVRKVQITPVYTEIYINHFEVYCPRRPTESPRPVRRSLFDRLDVEVELPSYAAYGRMGELINREPVAARAMRAAPLDFFTTSF